MDITICGDSGTRIRQVALTATEHALLMRALEGMPAVLLTRLKDYYKDADFSPDDVIRLIEEVRAAAAQIRQQPLAAWLAELASLLDDAKNRGCGVSALAD